MSQATIVVPDGELCPGETYTIQAIGQLTPIVNYSWEQVDGPAGGSITFLAATESEVQVSVNIQGNYQFRYCYFTSS